MLNHFWFIRETVSLTNECHAVAPPFEIVVSWRLHFFWIGIPEYLTKMIVHLFCAFNMLITNIVLGEIYSQLLTYLLNHLVKNLNKSSIDECRSLLTQRPRSTRKLSFVQYVSKIYDLMIISKILWWNKPKCSFAYIFQTEKWYFTEFLRWVDGIEIINLRDT